MTLKFISSLVPLQSKRLFPSFAFGAAVTVASALPTTELVTNTSPAVFERVKDVCMHEIRYAYK